jgi:hypothetical protein
MYFLWTITQHYAAGVLLYGLLMTFRTSISASSRGPGLRPHMNREPQEEERTASKLAISPEVLLQIVRGLRGYILHRHYHCMTPCCGAQRRLRTAMRLSVSAEVVFVAVSAPTLEFSSPALVLLY